MNPSKRAGCTGFPCGDVQHSCHIIPDIELEPEQAFGQPNPRLVERIARNALPAGMELKENSIVEFTAPTGAAFSGFLRELNDTSALFDFNHPLAGKAIRFEVKLIGVM